VEALVDIRDVRVNKALPREQRISEFVRQIKNPYLFKCGQFTVHVGFTANGISLEECIAGLLR
jgi:hypothetical protein